MATVRWLHAKPNHRRKFTAADLAQLGVEHDSEIVFSAPKWTVEMNDRACETLVTKLPGEFVVLEPVEKSEPDPDEATGTASDDSPDDLMSADDPQESPDGSLSEADATTDESPKAKRPRR